MKDNKITFIYKSSFQHTKSFESLVKKVVELVKQIHVLPNNIEIQFEDMGPSIYGMTMLDPRFPNRIRLNQDLKEQEIIIPLTHELVHLNQTFTNRLQVRSGGRILWDKEIYKVNSLQLTYEDYCQLPWEQDATQKQTRLLEFISQNSKKIKSEIKRELHLTQNTSNPISNLS
jgi:hypothetical protein